MPHPTKLCALLILATTFGCASSKAKPVDLTVMTYNIHHGAGMDKRVDLPRIATLISRFHPDLVALQEIDVNTARTGHVDQATELGKLTKMQPIFGRAMDFDGGQYGVMILSRLPIKQHHLIELPYTRQPQHEPRVALAVRCKTNGASILFLSTHLDQNGTHTDRLAQAQKIDQFLAAETDPTILAGDFNCVPGSAPIELLMKHFFPASNADPAPTDPSINPRSKIDHIFVKPPARWRVLEAQVIDDQIASDHRPVVVKLQLLNQTAEPVLSAVER